MFTDHFQQHLPYCANFIALRQEDDRVQWTYQHLADWVERTKQALSRVLPNGTVTVGVSLWNQAEWVVTLLALWGLGHVVVPLNPTLTSVELAQVVMHAQLALLISDDRLFTRPDTQPFTVDCTVPCPVGHWHAGGLYLPEPRVLAKHSRLTRDPLPSDLALLIYTSGTTGQPKAVMLTHENVWADVSANLHVMQATEHDRFISLSPFFHVFGLINVLLTSLAVGAQLTLIRRFHPGRVLQQLYQGQVSVLTGVPTMYQQLLRHYKPASVHVHTARRLRVCHSGAAPMPEPLFHAIEQQLDAPVQEGYGLSEASSIVTSNPLAGCRKPGSIGLAIPGVSTCLRNDQGQPITLPNTMGELWIAGPTVMPGYWRDTTAHKLVKDANTVWLKSGDCMTQDADGYLRFIGRADDQLNIGGLKCYPVEIETVLLSHPNVLEAAVYLAAVGQLHANVVTVKPTDNLTNNLTQTLRRFALERLSPYKVPKVFHGVDTLPKGPTGKLLRRQLAMQRM
jgi:long-chain acyl-CoA synthetase